MVIGIAGGSGSGKTTYARKLLGIIGNERGLILAQDSYYKDHSAQFERDPQSVNFDIPSALDFDLMTEQLILLKKGSDIECPRYNFVTHSRFSDAAKVKVKPIVIVEGTLIFNHRPLFKEFDLTFFMEADEKIRLERRTRRDLRERGRTVEQVNEQFLSQVKPAHDQFIEPTKTLATYLIKT